MITEQPVFFPCADDTLFGVLAAADGPRDLAAVVVAEGTIGGIRGQGGTLIRLSRAIAGAPCPTLRFDYHGLGESSGVLTRMRRDEVLRDDLSGAMDLLRSRGFRRFVLVGSCIGAQTALVTASETTDVLGAALASCIMSASNDDPSMSSEVTLGAAARAASRGVQLLFCYGREDKEYDEFVAARERMQNCLAAATTTVEILEGKIHSFPDVARQDELIGLIVSFVEGVRTRADRSGGSVADPPGA